MYTLSCTAEGGRRRRPTHLKVRTDVVCNCELSRSDSKTTSMCVSIRLLSCIVWYSVNLLGQGGCYLEVCDSCFSSGCPPTRLRFWSLFEGRHPLR